MSRRQPVSFEENGVAAAATPTMPIVASPNALPNGYFSDRFSDGVASPASPSTTTSSGRRRASMSISIPPPPSRQADMAFTALQYLPMPVLVLSGAKRIVLANEAMGRLLGIEVGSSDIEEDEVLTPGATLDRPQRSVTETLYGVDFSQLGFDLLQGGSAVFVAWEDFLETVINDACCVQCPSTYLNKHRGRTRAEAGANGDPHRRHSSRSSLQLKNGAGSRTEVHDAVVDVVFSTHRDPVTGLPLVSRHDVCSHIQAQMIVSVWATEEEQYFTLTFTASSDGSSSSASDVTKTTSRTVSRSATSYSGMTSGLSSASSSGSSSRPRKSSSHARTHTSASDSYAVSPTVPPSRNDTLNKGPPIRMTGVSAPTIFTKSNRLKDAILNSMTFPAYAMWKDESFGIPNKAAIKLIYPWIEDGVYDHNDQARDFLAKYVLYDEDFTAEIPLDEFPIMRLMRERKAFSGFRIGMYSAKDGSRMLYDVIGEPILDDKGEFLGGLVIFQDVTDFTNIIDRQKKENEDQFENICNKVPQMIWRTTPDGHHDYFSDRWYSYTGLSVEDSCGEGWVAAFHTDDVAVVQPVWKHSLATGDEYLVEYRCKNAVGEWRWMLGRAVPMRDEKDNIIKWFGSCTDIHDLVIAREEAKQMRARLAGVIEHANITLWAIDLDYRLTLFEGKPMYQNDDGSGYQPRDKYIGMHLEDIFKVEGRQNETGPYVNAIHRVITGKVSEEVIEVQIASTSRWFRTRIMPVMRQERIGGVAGESFIDGVVGISMDITAHRTAEQEIRERDRENARLMAQSVAAKEASKMKSQFLANMSHEIRTPIAGVIGMSELLLDDDSGELTKDQRECATNIQRSANGLLTVINDILDFSKVESGRLDIEEVPFDLSVVIQDVNKMLSFAAERKGLKYNDDIQELHDWKLMGDPGRLRQVMTNLLTNSIKFTSDGSVTLRVKVRKETRETVEVVFTVEDTGVGIEEEGLQKLFKPFAQADSSTARRFGGTGLGLTISKNLVELMHGEISLHSKLGIGTKAVFSIPFHKAAFQSSTPHAPGDVSSIPDRLQSDLSISHTSSEKSGPTTPNGAQVASNKPASAASPKAPHAAPVWSPEEEQKERLPEAERKHVNILVVEDNPINQQIAMKTIKKLGFPVNAVWNGKEAVEYLQNPSDDQPRPDVILMDVQMPIMDGYLATYTIRNSHAFRHDPVVRNTPIVAMTASAIQGDREKCQKSGMDDYLAKPVKKTNLEKMLVKWTLESRKKRQELAQNPDAATSTLSRPQGPRSIPSFTSETSSHLQSPEEHLSAELDRLEFTHRAVLQRSAESSNDVALRQQQAEEKAIALRDETLLEAGDDPKTRLGRGYSDEAYHPTDSDALTTENVIKHSQADRTSVLRRQKSSPFDDDNSSMVVATSDVTDALSRKPSRV